MQGWEGVGAAFMMCQRFAATRVATSRKGSARQDQSQMQAAQSNANSGDEAAPGTAGSGDDGKSRIDCSPCPNCGGNETITRAIGGA
jgi:hypothetical protein